MSLLLTSVMMLQLIFLSDISLSFYNSNLVYLWLERILYHLIIFLYSDRNLYFVVIVQDSELRTVRRIENNV